MPRPVYVFSGFIDSGKTQAIKNTLVDDYFTGGTPSLIVCFEQGDVEYDEQFCKETKTQVVYLDSISDFTLEKQKELNKQYKYDRIILELNGMEDDNILYDTGLIRGFEFAQILAAIDASKFEMYLNNMRQFLYNHVKYADCIILNRSDNVNKRYLRNNLKSINQKVDLIFEDQYGNCTNKIEDDLFDTTKDLVIEDMDYGLWFMDAIDNPDKYDKKNVTIKVKYLATIEEYNNALIMGRKAMVCCANDITDIAIPIINIHEKDIDKEKWYSIKGTAHKIVDSNGQAAVAIYASDFSEADAPSEELVTFN